MSTADDVDSSVLAGYLCTWRSAGAVRCPDIGPAADTTSSSTPQATSGPRGELAECVGERGRDGLDRLRAVVRGLVDNDGISYIRWTGSEAVTDSDGTTMPSRQTLDALPMVISAEDWDT